MAWFRAQKNFPETALEQTALAGTSAGQNQGAAMTLAHSHSELAQQVGSWLNRPPCRERLRCRRQLPCRLRGLTQLGTVPVGSKGFVR